MGAASTAEPGCAWRSQTTERLWHPWPIKPRIVKRPAAKARKGINPFARARAARPLLLAILEFEHYPGDGGLATVKTDSRR